MKIQKQPLVFIFSLVILPLCMGLLVTPTVQAKTADDECTFNFEKLTVVEALQQITRVTGVKIHINKPLDKTFVGKSYQDATVEKIIQDLFRQENVAIEWRYGQGGLDTVSVTLYEAQKNQQPLAPSRRNMDEPKVAINTPGTVNQASDPAKASMWPSGEPVMSHHNAEMALSPITARKMQIGAAGSMNRAASQQNRVSYVPGPTSIVNNSPSSVPIPVRMVTPPARRGLEPPPMPPVFR